MISSFESNYIQENFPESGDEKDVPVYWHEMVSDSEDDEESEFEQEPVMVEINVSISRAPLPLQLPKKVAERPEPEQKVQEGVELPLRWCSAPSAGQKRKLDHREFPSLASAARKISVRHPKMPRFNSKRTISLREFLGRQETESGWEKKKAAKKVAKKEKVLKFAMCNSYTTGDKCKFGERCHFAHKLSELTVAKCSRNHECHFAVFIDGEWLNAGVGKVCWRIHEGESRRDFFLRLESVKA